MRGRPTCLLLRRFAPLAAVAALVGPAAALAAPSPDRAPSSSSGIAPDPAPGSRPDAHTAAPAQPASRATPAATAIESRPVYVVPARHVPRHPPRKPAKPKPAVVRHRVAARQAAFLLPRVALPVLGSAAASVGDSHDEEVVLAVVALLLAAAAAGSGARLVSTWNRAGAA